MRHRQEKQGTFPSEDEVEVLSLPERPEEMKIFPVLFSDEFQYCETILYS